MGLAVALQWLDIQFYFACGMTDSARFRACSNADKFAD